MFVSDNKVISVMPHVDLCFPTKIAHFCREPEVRVNHLKVPGLIFFQDDPFKMKTGGYIDMKKMKLK